MDNDIDNADEAAELLGGKDAFGGLLEKTDAAAQACAERREMELPDEAIFIVQQHLTDMVVRVGESDSEASVDGLIDEMDDPEGRKAQANIAFIIGSTSTEHMALRRLGSAIMAENYEQAG